VNEQQEKGTLSRLIGELCDSLHEDDGIDPRHTNRKRRRERRGDARSSPHYRKRAQLRSQVTEALVFWIREQDEESLADLTLIDVEPFPDTDHFRVILATRQPVEDEVIDLGAIQQTLERMAPDARRWVGQEIHRKRVPLISFAVIPAAQ